MSRVGKLPIPIPKGVTVENKDRDVTVKGPKGVLSRTIHPKVIMNIEQDVIKVSPVDESRDARALWGLTRTLINNMVVGVTQGFTKGLEIVGVGYRVELKGQQLVFNLGYSHPIEFDLPKGISASVDKQNKVTLEGIDKELLGQTAATVRSFRKPEPYKGKGIRYAGEVVRRKVGKAGAK
jgi:large subunit ribosomal protein L6